MSERTSWAVEITSKTDGSMVAFAVPGPSGASYKEESIRTLFAEMAGLVISQGHDRQLWPIPPGFRLSTRGPVGAVWEDVTLDERTGYRFSMLESPDSTEVMGWCVALGVARTCALLLLSGRERMLAGEIQPVITTPDGTGAVYRVSTGEMDS